MLKKTGLIAAVFWLFCLVPAFSPASEGLADNIIYQPGTDIYGTPKNFNIKYEELKLKSASGPLLNAWLTPAGGELTILIFSGNGGNISIMLDRIVTFHLGGFSTLAVDYPGYGSSEGEPSEEGLYEAAEAAWKYLVEEKRAEPAKIVIYGFSLGGGVAAYLAEKHRPRALILDSTFTRLSAVPSSRQPALKMVFEAALGRAFDTKSRLAKIKCPLLILHSREDQVVPFELGLELYEAYQNNNKLMAEGRGGHMDFMFNPAEYIPALKTIIMMP